VTFEILAISTNGKLDLPPAYAQFPPAIRECRMVARFPRIKNPAVPFSIFSFCATSSTVLLWRLGLDDRRRVVCRQYFKSDYDPFEISDYLIQRRRSAIVNRFVILGANSCLRLPRIAMSIGGVRVDHRHRHKDIVGRSDRVISPAGDDTAFPHTPLGRAQRRARTVRARHEASFISYLVCVLERRPAESIGFITFLIMRPGPRWSGIPSLMRPPHTWHTCLEIRHQIAL
jgi:hypothetical protein